MYLCAYRPILFLVLFHGEGVNLGSEGWAALGRKAVENSGCTGRNSCVHSTEMICDRE